jgi:hypothetical protein
MSRAVPLSRIQELGIRGRDDPAAEPVLWAGMAVNAGGLRALHEALHPTLLLLALAGYRIDELVLGPPADGDVLLVSLSPRSAVAVPWSEYMETDAAEWPFSGRFGVLVWLKLHPGLTGGAVAVEATGGLVPHVRMIAGWPFLGYDLDVPADMGSIVNRLTGQQQAVRLDLASRIKVAWAGTNWDETTTGLLSALQPDLWAFPHLADDQDLRRQALRRLGEAIAVPALASENTLQSFLIEEAAVRNGGQPPSVHDRLVAVDPDGAEDLERGWNTEAEALWNEVNPEAGRDPFRAADHRRLSYCELVFDMLNESLISLAGYDPAAGESAYGGYDLRRGDYDPAEGEVAFRYAGSDGALEAGAPRTTYVDELRRDLAQIGFGPLADGDIVDDPTLGADEPDAATKRRTFGAYLEAAVREFQIYATMGYVARVGAAGEVPAVTHPSLATGLVQEVNDQPYSGPISGVLNARTRGLVKMWVERDWHCPVVVEARALTQTNLRKLRDPASTADKRALVTGTSIGAAHHNMWRRTQLEDDDYSFIAWDFTRHYPASATRPEGEPVVIARWGNAGSWGGAFAQAGLQTWPEAEILPENISGVRPDLAGRPQQGPFWSTYRVIRAISEVECQGVIDGMNAYDSAILSGGPVHFTLGLAKQTNGVGLHSGPRFCVIYPGELCPSLSLLAAHDPPEYERFFGAFGMQPRERLADPPDELYSSGHRKYRGWVLLQDDAGDFVDTRKVNPDSVAAGEPLAANHDDFLLVEVLHHWHWIYRWQMAPRFSRVFRELTYILARARLRALLSTPWGMLSGAPAGLTLGDVFTSEKAVAILERIHVYSPPRLFMVEDIDAEWHGQTTIDISFARIQGAFDAAKATGGVNPADWGDVEERALVAWLEAANLKDDIPTLVQWPIEGSYQGRRHDLSILPLAREEAPDIGAIAPLAAAPGAETSVRFTVTDRETAPGGCEVSATSGDEDVLVASVAPAGGTEYDLVLAPPAGADGEVKVTVLARDRRHSTTREVMVNVTADGALPAGAAAPYARPAPIGLSEQRGSFQLDVSGLFTQPDD